MPSAFCGGRVDFHPAAPHRGRERVWHFLQPRQVRERAIQKGVRGVGQEMKWILLRAAVELRSDKRQRCGRSRPAGRARRREAGRQRSRPDAFRLRVGPCVDVRRCRGQAGKCRAEHLVECLPRQGKRPAKAPPDLEEYVGCARASGTRAASRAAPRWPRPSWPRTRAPPRSTTRGTNDPAGSGPRGCWFHRGSC